MKVWWRIRARYQLRRARALYRNLRTSSQYERARDHVSRSEKFFALIKEAAV